VAGRTASASGRNSRCAHENPAVENARKTAQAYQAESENQATTLRATQLAKPGIFFDAGLLPLSSNSQALNQNRSPALKKTPGFSVAPKT
jgi:hypothetical protein